MASNHGSLVKEATLLLDKFSAGQQLCLDDFLEDASQVMKNVKAEDKRFILDIVCGCVEHKKLLDIVINVFYAQNGKCLSRGDRHQFVIICYLAMFMQDAIGFPHFSNSIKSLDIKKMHTFLTFFFNVTNLTTWIRGEWSQIYDSAYVERNWISPLLRWCPEIDVLLDQLAARMSRSGALVKKDPTKKTTEPQEFSLTKPKPRPLLAPEAIPSQEKHKPVPNSTYRLPNEIKAVEEIKQINRQKAEQMLYEVNIKQFKCANPQKSEHTKNVISQIREDLDSKLKFNSFHSSGAPATHKVETNTWQVKLNNTAILREGALYNRQVEVELQRMERLVEGEGEPSSFLRWQKEMRDRDLQESIAQVELRRLEGLISHEEAAMARTRIMEHNQKNVQLKKEETAQLMQRYAQKRLQEEKEMRDLVQKVTEGHKNSKAAKVKLQEFKQRIVKEVSEQIQDLLRQALEEAQAELSRKFEIIREIHAMESVPFIRHKFLDDTETAGHDLLGEMSLAELKERLAILKEAERHEQQKRHEWILEEKHNKELLLLDQLDAIDLHRKALGHAAACRKEEKKATLALQQKAVAGDERVLALQKKLAEKQQERQRLRENERNKVKSSDLANPHAVKNSQHKSETLEKECWEDLERCLEHQVQKESPNTQDIVDM